MVHDRLKSSIVDWLSNDIMKEVNKIKRKLQGVVKAEEDIPPKKKQNNASLSSLDSHF